MTEGPHCKNMAQAYKIAATELKGKVNVGAVDIDLQKELEVRFQIDGYPTILVYDGKTFEPYDDDRTAEAFVE